MTDDVYTRAFWVAAACAVGLVTALCGQAATGSTAEMHSVTVAVTDLAGNEPGIPIEVRFRSETGVVVHAKTDSKGFVDVLIPKKVEAQIKEVQVIFPISDTHYLATLESYDSQRDAYCLDLPNYKTDCLNWVK